MKYIIKLSAFLLILSCSQVDIKNSNVPRYLYDSKSKQIDSSTSQFYPLGQNAGKYYKTCSKEKFKTIQTHCLQIGGELFITPNCTQLLCSEYDKPKESDFFTLSDVKDCSEKFTKSHTKQKVLESLIAENKDVITVNLDCFDFGMPYKHLKPRFPTKLGFKEVNKLIITGSKYSNIDHLKLLYRNNILIKETHIPFAILDNTEAIRAISLFVRQIPRHKLIINLENLENMPLKTVIERMKVLERVNYKIVKIYLQKDVVLNLNKLENKSLSNVLETLHGSSIIYKENISLIHQEIERNKKYHEDGVITQSGMYHDPWNNRNEYNPKVYMYDNNNLFLKFLDQMLETDDINRTKDLVQLKQYIRRNKLFGRKLKSQNKAIVKTFHSNLKERDFDIKKIKKKLDLNDYVITSLLIMCIKHDCTEKTLKTFFAQTTSSIVDNHVYFAFQESLASLVRFKSFKTLLSVLEAIKSNSLKVNEQRLKTELAYLEKNKDNLLFLNQLKQTDKAFSDIELYDYSKHSYSEVYTLYKKHRHHNIADYLIRKYPFNHVRAVGHLREDFYIYNESTVFTEPDFNSKVLTGQKITKPSQFNHFKNCDHSQNPCVKLYNKTGNFYQVKVKNKKYYIHQRHVESIKLLEEMLDEPYFKDDTNTYIRIVDRKVEGGILKLKGKSFSKVFEAISAKDYEDEEMELKNAKEIWHNAVDKKGELNFWYPTMGC